MRKSSILVILLVTSIVNVWASVIDSLKLRLTDYSAQDSVKVDLLNQLGYEHWIFDPDQSIEYSNEALDLATSLNYRNGVAYANRSLGVASWTQGNYEEGLNYLLTALIEYQSLSDTLNIANVMMNTALIYMEQDSYEEALRYFSEALTTFQLLEKPTRYINTANHLGELFQKQGLYKDAQNYYQKSLRLSDSINYNYGRATAYLNLGSLYKENKQLDSAIFYSRRAVSIQENSRDLNGLATSYFNLGTIYNLQSDFLMAEQNLLKGLDLAYRLGSKKLRRDIYLELTKVSKENRDFRKSTEYLEKYTQVNDSLLNAEMLKNIIRLENRIALEKKEAEVERQSLQLELLEKEARIDNILLVSMAIGIVVLLVLVYLIRSRQKIKMRKNKELLIKSQELNESQRELTQVAIENAKLKERELLQDLEFKNKELTSYTLNFIRKNELLAEIKTGLIDLKNGKESDSQKLRALTKLVDSSVNIDRDWNDFKLHFEEVHANFFGVLSDRFPDITSNELKLCALLKLNMNLKEAANIMGISPESVKTARYRLRKKLGLSKDDNLVEYVINLEGNVGADS